MDIILPWQPWFMSQNMSHRYWIKVFKFHSTTFRKLGWNKVTFLACEFMAKGYGKHSVFRGIGRYHKLVLLIWDQNLNRSETQTFITWFISMIYWVLNKTDIPFNSTEEKRMVFWTSAFLCQFFLGIFLITDDAESLKFWFCIIGKKPFNLACRLCWQNY